MSDASEEGEAAFADHLAEQHIAMARVIEEWADARSAVEVATSRLSAAEEELASKFGIVDVAEYLTRTRGD